MINASLGMSPWVFSLQNAPLRVLMPVTIIYIMHHISFLFPLHSVLFWVYIWLCAWASFLVVFKGPSVVRYWIQASHWVIFLAWAPHFLDPIAIDTAEMTSFPHLFILFLTQYTTSLFFLQLYRYLYYSTIKWTNTYLHRLGNKALQIKHPYYYIDALKLYIHT